MKQWVINEPNDLFDVEDYGLVFYLTKSDEEYTDYDYNIYTKGGIETFTWWELKNCVISKDHDGFEIF